MTQFDAVTSVARTSDTTYDAELTGIYNIGAVPNGGYQVATMCRAALDALGAPDVINVSTYFLGPAAPGPATLAVEIVKKGRTSSVAEVRLFQADRERARAIVLAGDLGAMTGPELHRTEAPKLPAPDACFTLSLESGGPTIFGAIDLRLDPTTIAFTRGETGAPPEMRAWMRFGDGRAPDVLALPLFADTMPPTTFNHLGFTAWVPTLELTVQVRRRPALGWLRVGVVTRHISSGHLEEDGELWDDAGQLVAISRQRAMLLPT